MPTESTMSHYDPLAILRFALAQGDRALAELLIEHFAFSRTLSRRTMRELAGLAPAREGRSVNALALLLGLDSP